MTVTLKIQKSVYGGDGLGRLGDGRVAFVPGAFPGETVKAEITSEKKRFVNCALKEIVEPSPDRIVPGDIVPGMVYAAISPKAELEFKRSQLENFLQKLPREAKPPELIVKTHAIGSPLAYRNKAIYRLQKPASRNGQWKIGYLRENSHDVEDTPCDPLVVPEIASKLASIRADIHTILTQGAVGVRQWAAGMESVTIRHTAMDGVKWFLGAPPKDLVLKERTCGLTFKVAADGFYQVNPVVGEALVKRVVEAYMAGIDQSCHILDLYCGVGVFGICAAKSALAADRQVRLTGAESSRAATALAKENAAAAGVAGKFFCEKVGASVRRFKVGRQHVVIVDPPRGGLEQQTAQWLSKCRAGRIFYVSCDPATLQRDLATIAKGGIWRIDSAELFNMFPRTARFESFIQLSNKSIPAN